MSTAPLDSFIFCGLSMGRAHRCCRFLCSRRSTIYVFLVAVCIAVYAPLLWVLPTVPPGPPRIIPIPCHDDVQGYNLEEEGICTRTCGRLCFPRVHGICFYHAKVTVCDEKPSVLEHAEFPSKMRFYLDKPRQKVPVRYGSCPDRDPFPHLGSAKNRIMKDDHMIPIRDENVTGQARWIHGLQMVADLTLMPVGRVGPNPHHEAEKVVPAIVFSQLEELRNSSLYWFADPNDPLMISKWSLGLLDVFAHDLRVQYVVPVGKDEAPICFEDAILFTGVTNSGYMPNVGTHDWFRNRVLDYCNVSVVNAHRPVQDAVIVHRPNSSRNIWNYEVVKRKMEEKLQIPVKMVVPGPWAFCDQVRLVAEADILLTPHGSQNANLLVLRPGATVIEVFPLLYYINWYRHYLHSGRVNHYELFGTWLPEKGSMPLIMRIYAYLYGWQRCFFVRRCMNYGKSQQIYIDVDHLDSLLQNLISSCSLVVQRSGCPKRGQ